MGKEMSRRRLLIGCGWVMLAALGGCSPQAPRFHAQEVTGAGYGRGFSLPDTEGRIRTLADFRGEVLGLYFGFIQCPDVCPTALSRAVAVKEQLGAQGARFRIAFVTVDPERDTPSVVRSYLNAFDPSFVGLIPPDQETLAKVAREYRVFYRKVPTGSSYTMDHTATTFVYDPQGRLRLAVPHALGANEFAADVALLLQGA